MSKSQQELATLRAGQVIPPTVSDNGGDPDFRSLRAQSGQRDERRRPLGASPDMLALPGPPGPAGSAVAVDVR